MYVALLLALWLAVAITSVASSREPFVGLDARSSLLAQQQQTTMGDEVVIRIPGKENRTLVANQTAESYIALVNNGDSLGSLKNNLGREYFGPAVVPAGEYELVRATGLRVWVAGFVRMIFGSGNTSLLQAILARLNELGQLLRSKESHLRINPSTVGTTTAKELLGRYNIPLSLSAALPGCCNLTLPAGGVLVPRFESRRTTSEVQLMEPARRHIQTYLVPPGVLVLQVESRHSLVFIDGNNNAQIRGKTDFLLVDESIARRILGPDLDVRQQISDAAVSSLMRFAVVGLLELKTATATNGDAYKFWPHAACQAVALQHLTGRALPVFAGDLNHMVLVHWGSTQQEEPQGQLTLHVGASLEAGAMHAAMRLLTEQQLQAIRTPGDNVQQPQQQQEPQSPDDGRGRPEIRPAAVRQNLGRRAVLPTAPQLGVQTRGQRAATGGTHQSQRNQYVANPDVSQRSLQEVYEGAISCVTEAIEYDVDVDMSALDQVTASRCDLDSRIINTLKHALPAALAAQQRAPDAV